RTWLAQGHGTIDNVPDRCSVREIAADSLLGIVRGQRLATANQERHAVPWVQCVGAMTHGTFLRIYAPTLLCCSASRRQFLARWCDGYVPIFYFLLSSRSTNVISGALSQQNAPGRNR